MLYEFELDHNTMEATKNICYPKCEDIVDLTTAHRWFKNIDDQESSDRPKIMGSKAVIQAIGSNPASCIQRVTVLSLLLVHWAETLRPAVLRGTRIRLSVFRLGGSRLRLPDTGAGAVQHSRLAAEIGILESQRAFSQSITSSVGLVSSFGAWGALY